MSYQTFTQNSKPPKPKDRKMRCENKINNTQAYQPSARFDRIFESLNKIYKIKYVLGARLSCGGVETIVISLNRLGISA